MISLSFAAMVSCKISDFFWHSLTCLLWFWYLLSKKVLSSFERLYFKRIFSLVESPYSYEDGELDFSGWLSSIFANSSGSMNFLHFSIFSCSRSIYFLIRSSSAQRDALAFSATSALDLSISRSLFISLASSLSVTFSSFSWINFFSLLTTASSYCKLWIKFKSFYYCYYAWFLTLFAYLLFELDRWFSWTPRSLLPFKR